MLQNIFDFELKRFQLSVTIRKSDTNPNNETMSTMQQCRRELIQELYGPGKIMQLQQKHFQDGKC